jgi:ketosteroid isomerase-like protein
MLSRKLPALVGLALTVTACQGGPAMLSDADAAAIRAGSDTFAENVVSGNRAAVAALYTEDATLMPPNEAAIQGRANIQAWMEAFPPVTQMDLTIEEMEGRGDMAFVRGTFTMTLAPEGVPEPIQERGKYLEIRKKQADGSWLMTADIFNSDLPLPQ